MTFKQLIQLLPKVVRYNLKIIFAGKFFWFLLAAFGFFALFMFQNAWKREEINEGLIYSILMFPSMLLIFYPAVFGIQNDEDSRILEILFGIPDYKYKVWGVRLLMIYVAIFVILIVFSYIAILLLYPVNPLDGITVDVPDTLFRKHGFYAVYHYAEWKRNCRIYDYYRHCIDVLR